MQIFAVGSGHLYFSLLASSTVIFVYDMVVVAAVTAAFVFVIIIVFVPFNIYYWLCPSLNGWSHFSWFRIKLIFQCCVLGFFHFRIHQHQTSQTFPFGKCLSHAKPQSHPILLCDDGNTPTDFTLWALQSAHRKSVQHHCEHPTYTPSWRILFLDLKFWKCK